MASTGLTLLMVVACVIALAGTVYFYLRERVTLRVLEDIKAAVLEQGKAIESLRVASIRNATPSPAHVGVSTAVTPDSVSAVTKAPLDVEVLDLARVTLRVARSRTQGIDYPGGTVAVLSYTPEQRVRVEALAARWGCDVPDAIVRLLQIALDLDEDPPPPASSLN